MRQRIVWEIEALGRWLFWCWTFRQLCPWNVHYVGKPRHLTDEEIEHFAAKCNRPEKPAP